MSFPLKHVAVLGATGNSGAPVIRALIERKKEFDSITAITTNDPSHQKFKALKDAGVNVIQIDLASKESILKALKGQDALVIALGGSEFCLCK